MAVVALESAFVALAMAQSVGERASDGGGEQARGVLILHSYYPTFTWTDDITAGITSAFAPRADEFNLYFEYMDAKRHPEREYLDLLRQLYRHKYVEHDSTGIELIITSDDQALNFVLDWGDDLLAAVPVVFCGVNGYTPAMRERGRAVTGVLESIEPRETLETALRLHPDAREVVVITDITRTGRAIRDSAMSVYRDYEPRLAFTYLDDLSMEDLLERVAGLREGTLVMLSVFNRDNLGRDYTHEHSLQLIAGRCRMPIYGFWSFYLGHGIVGGKLVSGRAEGEAAARLALRVLDGEDAGQIPVITRGPHRHMYDYEQLVRFGIDTARLPVGSVVVNRPRSLYAEYETLIWRGGGAIAVLSLVVVILAVVVAQRRRAQMRLQTILHTALDGFCVMDADGTIRDVNEAYCRMVGYARDELLRMNMSQLAAGESTEEIRRHVERIAQTGSERFESRHRRKDGALIDLEVSATYMRREGRVFTFFRDITARNRAEQAIRQSETTLGSIFRAAPIGIGLVSARTLLRVNDRLCAMLGRSPDELVGRSARILYPDDEEFERVGREKYAEIRERGTGTIETRWQRADGAIIDVLLSSTPLDPSDHSVGVTFTALDITDRKRAIDGLRKVSSFLRTVIEQAPFGIQICEGTRDNWQLTMINREAQRIVGVTEEQHHGLGLSDGKIRHPEKLTWQMFHADGRQWPPNEAPLPMAMSHGKVTWNEEMVVRRADGQESVILCNAAPIRDTNGELIGGVVTYADITERKKTEKERESLERQLRQAQKMEAVGQLAGGVAHDFNNILTAIIGNVEMLQQSLAGTYAPDDVRLTGLQQVERGALRAAGLTRQLLMFSRRSVVQPELLDLNQTLTEAIRMLQRLLTENIRLDVKLDGEILPICADAGEIEQIIMNLVLNARDAMPDGGRLVVETANAELDEAYAATHAEVRVGRHVVLAVSDTGCGMSPETQERIFEPFFTTKPIGRGTGLGLATVYGIVKQANGHIQVYSEPGRGTTFRVYLPAAELPGARGRAAAVPEELPRGSETVLVCEDDDTVRELEAQMLREAGYTVLVARNGQEALDLAGKAAASPALLLTDVIMPDTNGRKLADALTSSRPGLRVLFVSGYTADVIADHGVLDEGVEFLAKPFSRRALLRRVREVLDQAAASDSSR